ncbi:MAG: DUF4214 domain-containing protein, partial [Burkholderiaceae bacterium]|nr:DUF4214 domain-containing protein [Burkholderiaceae bacterium]
MAAADYTNLVQELYISYFGRPADTMGLFNISNVLDNAAAPTTLDGLLTAYDTTPAVKSLIDSFSGSAESQALYGNDVIGFVSAVYQNVLNRPADIEGATFWINAIQNGGLTMGKAALAIMAGALNNDSDQGLIDAQVVANKVAIANSFTTSIDTGLELNAYRGNVAAAAVRELLSTVTADTDTVAFQAEIDNTLADLVTPPPVVTPEPAPVVQLKLTVGQDDANGTAGNDTFTARVAQNANGEQTNQLATGDQVNGGAGTDTLLAKVQMASALNHGPASAILPETVDLEVVKFTALTVDNSATAAAQHETVTINAKEMLGLDLVGSVQSDASLVIENLTTLTDSGVYESRRDTSAVTIRMDHTGNDAAIDAESDLTVLFDNDYLGAGKTNTTKAFYWLLDEKAELALLEATTPVPAGRLNAINVDGITFDIAEADGTVTHHTLSNREAWDTNETDHTIATHQKFIDALQAPLQAMIDSGEVPAGTTLTLDLTLLDDTGLDHNLQSNSIPAIVLTLGGGLTVTPTGFAQVEDALPGFYDVYGRVDNVEDPRNLPVTSTVELEKVGRGAEGGDLTIGAMSTDFKNEWDFSDSALKEGIEQFNITVSGDKTQFSDLASLQSTNNTLAIVNIDWKAGSAANLTIGNHNTVGVAPNLAGVSDDD